MKRRLAVFTSALVILGALVPGAPAQAAPPSNDNLASFTGATTIPIRELRDNSDATV
jgi:hypothetical protein